MQSIRALTMVDLRNVNRDSMLKFMFLYPWLLALLVRWLVPYVAAGMVDLHDVRPYYPLIGALFGVLLGPMMVGATIGLLLLDERDDRTLTALQVTPLTMNQYLTYRLAIPVAVSILAIFIGIPLMNLIRISSWELAPIAVLAALEAPIFTLVVAIFSANKVQGFAVMKAMGIFLIGPTAAWFVLEPWQWWFGVLPTYWPVKAIWMLLDGEPYWAAIVVGLVVHLVLLVVLVRRFNVAAYRLNR